MGTEKDNTKVKDSISRRELLQAGVIGAAGLAIGSPNIVYGMAIRLCILRFVACHL